MSSTDSKVAIPVHTSTMIPIVSHEKSNPRASARTMVEPG